MFRIIKRADIILLIIFILLGFAVGYISIFHQHEGKDVIIKVNGKIYGTYPLNKNQTITIKDGHNINKVIIKNKKVQMAYSSCKNQICVHHNPIDKANQNIACLPNRVFIIIKGGDDEYDSIAQ